MNVFVTDNKIAGFINPLKATDTKVISSPEALEEWIARPFYIENLIVCVELNWRKPASFFGYEVAHRLMFSSQRKGKFNLLFLSTFKRRILRDIINFKTTSAGEFFEYANLFVRKFPHAQLTHKLSFDELNIPKLSQRKFDYLKEYCFHESHLPGRLIHDINNIIISPESNRLINFKADINNNADALTPTIISLTNELRTEKSHSENVQIARKVLKHLENVLVGKNSELHSNIEKSNDSLLVIEDDAETNRAIATQLEPYFKVINCFTSGEEAMAELQQNGKKYDAVLSDLELIKDGFDDNIQGIDIIEYCQEKLPHMVIRIITSLPRQVVSGMLDVSLACILFKENHQKDKVQVIADAGEFSERLSQDIISSRKIFTMDGPSLSWWGKSLTQKINLFKRDTPSRYDRLWNDAFSSAENFISGSLNDAEEDQKISVSFPKNQSIIKEPESGWKIIQQLLTHRLIALWFSQIKYPYGFKYSGGDHHFGEAPSYAEQPGFQSGLETREYKSYFNTLLGLSIKKLKQKDGQKQLLTINAIALFDEEKQWLQSFLSEPLYKKYPNFHSMLMDIGDYFMANNVLLDEGILFNEDIPVEQTKELLIKLARHLGKESLLIRANITEIFTDFRNPIDAQDIDAWQPEITNSELESAVFKLEQSLFNCQQHKA